MYCIRNAKNECNLSCFSEVFFFSKQCCCWPWIHTIHIHPLYLPSYFQQRMWRIKRLIKGYDFIYSWQRAVKSSPGRDHTCADMSLHPVTPFFLSVMTKVGRGFLLITGINVTFKNYSRQHSLCKSSPLVWKGFGRSAYLNSTVSDSSFVAWGRSSYILYYKDL